MELCWGSEEIHVPHRNRQTENAANPKKQPQTQTSMWLTKNRHTHTTTKTRQNQTHQKSPRLRINFLIYLQSGANFLPAQLDFTVRLVKGSLSLKLKVDGKEIPLNEFVENILSGTIVGAVSSLRGVKEDWKKLEIEIQN